MTTRSKLTCGVQRNLISGRLVSDRLRGGSRALKGIEGFAGEMPVGISNMSRRARAMVVEVQKFLGEPHRGRHAPL